MTSTTIIQLDVEGMMCQRNCGTTVENALQAVPGVVRAKATFATKSAWAELEKNDNAAIQTTADDLVEAIEDIGFEASIAKTCKIYVHVEGMMCQRNCGTTVGNAVSQVHGVIQGEASFEYSQAWAEVPVEMFTKEMKDQVIDAIECVGFEASLISAEEALSQQEQIRNEQQQQQSSNQQQQEKHPAELNPNNRDNSASVIVLSVEGMSCAVCTGRVERALMEVPGVTSAFVSLATHRAEVTYDEYEDNLQDIDGLAFASQQKVNALGYPCEILSAGNSSTMNLQDNAKLLEDAKHSELRSWRSLLLLALSLLLPMLWAKRQMMHIMADLNMQDRSDSEYRQYHHTANSGNNSVYDVVPFTKDYHLYSPTGQYMLVVAFLSTLVQFLVGYRYYKGAWKAGRDFGMDFLVVLGTTSSYVYSVFVWLWLLKESHTQVAPDNTSLEPTFETGAMLLTFVTFGKFLEAYAKGKTSSALEALMKLQPLWASRIIEGFDGWKDPTLPSGTIDDQTISTTLQLSGLETEEISTWDVQIGDYLRVLPGSRIPADGVIVALSSQSTSSSKVKGLSSSSSGQDNKQEHQAVAYIDESAFSGEPFPVSKGVGDSVYGSSVNQLTVLVIRVTATGSNSVLAKIVKLMEDAQRQKAPIQALADQIASIFAPAVMGLALITFLLWVALDSEAETTEERIFLAFLSAISVIVVACPCALGLATPTAVMVGTGVGATHGLLIKGGSVLEEMQALDTIIFDKTGTLTTGRAVLGERKELVQDFKDPLLQNAPAQVLSATSPSSKTKGHNLALWLAACAEEQSEHPLAKAIVNAAKSLWGGDVTCSAEGCLVEDFVVVPGSGVECVVSKPLWGTYVVRVGSKQWAQEAVSNQERSPTLSETDTAGDDEVAHLRRMGQIGVYVSVLESFRANEAPDLLQLEPVAYQTQQRRVIGVLGVVDPIEAQAQSTVAALKKLGVDVWMCTGDHEITAKAVARQVGINDENVCAGVKPEEKAELVSRLQDRRDWTGNRSRSRVAFVGDGINDAVALARANVGVAIGAGTEVAVEAADVVLVRSNLHDVVVALHLSKVVFRRIRMNFVWAMAYNLLALPFAAGILYPFTDFRLPPEYAGLMMAFSSVSVVTSSLLLRNYKRPAIRDDGTMDGASGILAKLMHSCERKIPGEVAIRADVTKWGKKSGGSSYTSVSQDELEIV